VSWSLVYTKQAQKDAKKIASSNLRSQVQTLLDIIQYRKQLDGQRRALAEHLEKLASERKKPLDDQDQGLILHWEKTVINCRQQISKLERRLSR
jgi:mRNA-degrading endonuclease RelE of RelBE toxin-antitoxin system